MKRIGITGASGYVGQALISAAQRGGDTVVVLGRRQFDPALEWRHCELESPPAPDLLAGLDALIHLAADTQSLLQPAGGKEIVHALALAQQAARLRIPMVFVSSQAAAASAPSAYGRTKHAIEDAVRASGATVIRPGLVVGGSERGLFGLLCAAVRWSPVLPHLLPTPRVQPLHVEDLAQALLIASQRPDLSGRSLAVAGPPMAFDELLARIAKQRLRVWRWLLPVPSAPLRLLLRLLAPVLGPTFSVQRFDSLLRLPAMDCATDLSTLGLCLRSPNTLFERRGTATRLWLREAQALSQALLDAPASADLLRRYPRLLLRCDVTDPLPIPALLLALPVCLAALDAPDTRHTAAIGSLPWRMGVMLRLAEADPSQTPRFLGRRSGQSRWNVVIDLISAGSSELLRRCIAPWVRRLWRQPESA